MGTFNKEFVMNIEEDIDNDIPFYLSNNTQHYSIEQFPMSADDNYISLLHIIRSLHKNIDKLKILLNSINHKFSFIALSETWLKSVPHSYYFLPGYELIVNNRHVGTKAGGEVALYGVVLIAIRKIGQIRHYLDDDTTLRLVHAFVTSRLDSCNSLLYGLPDKELSKVQRVQNTAARLVSCLPRSHHVTPVLMKLHWLPVKMRTIYKILLLTFKAQIGKSPVYLSELVHQYAPTRSLRSSTVFARYLYKNFYQVLWTKIILLCCI